MHLWIVGSRSSLLALPAFVAVMTPPSVSCCAPAVGIHVEQGRNDLVPARLVLVPGMAFPSAC